MPERLVELLVLGQTVVVVVEQAVLLSHQPELAVRE
jgi:hypothetical protein